MAQYLPKIEAKIMVGVGAAFDFHTGAIKDSPQWMKRAGLQWAHRLVQEPGRLARRYLKNNPLFLWKIGLQLAGFSKYTLND
jgi:N-acetylglucosaminyldiphosphoundecaprenol N-acetyl-beta-D-mannosaminyltransferase